MATMNRGGNGTDTALSAATWHQDVAEIIANLEMREFPQVLDRCLERLVSFDLTVIFAYPNEAPPLLLHDGIRGHAPGDALTSYLNGTYLLDPFYTACARRVSPGLYRMSELAPDEFFEGEYVNSWEVHPCISMESGSLAEEIGYMVPLSGGFMATYSLMRRNGNRPFSDAEIALLKQVEPVVRQAIGHHWRNLLVPQTQRSGWAPWERGEVMERAFERFGADSLTAREQMVVQLVLRGHSTFSIAEQLAIAEGTVKNHRKSIYAKLGITSQRELFTLFVRHVLN
jgi:DNA-binding CsgD family transcriptional regulator